MALPFREPAILYKTCVIICASPPFLRRSRTGYNFLRNPNPRRLHARQTPVLYHTQQYYYSSHPMAPYRCARILALHLFFEVFLPTALGPFVARNVTITRCFRSLARTIISLQRVRNNFGYRVKPIYSYACAGRLHYVYLPPPPLSLPRTWGAHAVCNH